MSPAETAQPLKVEVTISVHQEVTISVHQESVTPKRTNKQIKMIPLLMHYRLCGVVIQIELPITLCFELLCLRTTNE